MQPSNGARCLIFGQILRLPYFMCANSEDRGETAQAYLSLRWFDWFDFCFTALRHILGHFGRGQLT